MNSTSGIHSKNENWYRNPKFCLHRLILNGWPASWHTASWCHQFSSTGSHSYHGRFLSPNKQDLFLSWNGWHLTSLFLLLLVSITSLHADHVWASILICIIGLSCFFTFMTVAEGGGRRAVVRKFQDVYIPALKANFMLWPAVQILNFRVIPLQFQIVSIQLTNYIMALISSYSRLFRPLELLGRHTSRWPIPLTKHERVNLWCRLYLSFIEVLCVHALVGESVKRAR